MKREAFYDGKELEPLEALDLQKCDSIDDLVRSMSRTSFGGRRVGEAADVLEAMIKDKDCFRVLTLSGALTPAKQSLVICEMIDRGWINAIVSTGALICHGLVEGVGMKHYKADPKTSDADLFKKGYNRIYDTIEPETNLNNLTKIIQNVFKDQGPKVISSFQFCEFIGQYLAENTSHNQRAILKSAWEKRVPIYIPAFTDSELAIDFLLLNVLNTKIDTLDDLDKINPKNFSFLVNPMVDLWDFTFRISKVKKTGIFTVGGGVPRNWAQQVAPMVDYIRNNVDWKIPIIRYSYGIRICPEPQFWGGLSGCTYSESVSWGKFEADALTAEVFTDATIVFPFIVKAVMERIDSQ
ncbi:MAG: deoxyhypusine synthase family protein [Promethearchaeota archaeon]